MKASPQWVSSGSEKGCRKICARLLASAGRSAACRRVTPLKPNAGTPKRSTGQIRLERRLPSYWRVTFDIPPVNIFGPKEIPQLNNIITAIDRDEQVKVVVFDSAVEGLRGKVSNLDDAGFARSLAWCPRF